MKVFFSWSGARSKKVADILTNWIPLVIQAVDPWISAELDKGTRWQSEVSASLEEAKFSIICLTRDNLKAPWILFEAGALSKTSNSNLCTFLFDVTPNDVEFPLAQFQHTKYADDDIKRLTIDALGCHKAIAAQIVSQGGDYLLALKGNHPTLCEDVQRLLADEVTLAESVPARAETVEKDHGRIETRRAVAKRDTHTMRSVRLRLKRAGWDDAYLFRLLNI